MEKHGDTEARNGEEPGGSSGAEGGYTAQGPDRLALLADAAERLRGVLSEEGINALAGTPEVAVEWAEEWWVEGCPEVPYATVTATFSLPLDQHRRPSPAGVQD